MVCRRRRGDDFSWLCFPTADRETGAVCHRLAGRSHFRSDAYVESAFVRARGRQYYLVGYLARLRVFAQSRFVAAARSPFWLERCLAAVRSQPERAYNRCIEVRLPMGSFASL